MAEAACEELPVHMQAAWKACEDAFSMAWYSKLLARMHINSFRYLLEGYGLVGAQSGSQMLGKPSAWPGTASCWRTSTASGTFLWALLVVKGDRRRVKPSAWLVLHQLQVPAGHFWDSGCSHQALGWAVVLQAAGALHITSFRYLLVGSGLVGARSGCQMSGKPSARPGTASCWHACTSTASGTCF